ncbi:HNH endonuclease [Enterobacter kobei]|uniref:HNH endonuclease n=1 Tax=Enterobacter cloacae complex TaxID=354276 RepID=UPI001BE0B660|nr:HNH endonuclease [Enterobacter kobei]MBT1949615.1 HNH endonuclease [Enterobacter kobei]
MKMPSRNCPELTAEMVRELLEYDPTTGLLTWKTCRKKVQKGSVAGSVCGNGRKLYVKVRIGRLYRAHRLIWLIVTGEWPKYHIDHVDNDGTNNRWSNLRLATLNQNQHNRELSRANLTGYKGVSRANNLSKPYRANITIGRERRHLGYYRSAEEAAHAYDESARELFGEYARLNFPHENELAARKLLPGCAIDVMKTESA